jgi:uncharacterized YigZ family protein
MIPFSFRTIQNASEGSYKELGSKFLAFAYPVESEQEIKENIEHLKKKYFDATHHCFAWILGADRSRFRASDDGEPNHSAGDPILGQIRSRNLTNVLVVVVRYYGGTKLGVGNLIQAYRTTADIGLNNAQIIEKDVTERMTIEYSYAETSEVMRLIKEYDIKIFSEKYLDKSCMLLEVKLIVREAFFRKLLLLQQTGHQISFEDTRKKH